MYRFIIILLLGFGFSHLSFAVDQTGLSITKVGQDAGGSRILVGISPNPDVCSLAQVLFEGEMQLNRTLSTALTAKIASKTVQINYIKDADSHTCWGHAIFIE